MANRGRPKTGQKKRKALQLDWDVALRCPNISALINLLDEIKIDVHKSKRSSPRYTKLFELFDRIDALPKLIRYEQQELL